VTVSKAAASTAAMDTSAKTRSAKGASEKDALAKSTPATSATKALRQINALKFSATLGQIVALLMRVPHHRCNFLADLEWLVLPAIATNQIAIQEAPDAANILDGPAAAVLFASVSAEVDQRLTANPSLRVRLKPEEWASGSIPWLVDAVGDPRAANALVVRLLQQRFKATGLKTYGRGPDGKPSISLLRASDDKAAPPANGAA
jgi:hemolysin-activating ACP:hemolysin acyltransferase